MHQQRQARQEEDCKLLNMATNSARFKILGLQMFYEEANNSTHWLELKDPHNALWCNSSVTQVFTGQKRPNKRQIMGNGAGIGSILGSRGQDISGSQASIPTMF